MKEMQLTGSGEA